NEGRVRRAYIGIVGGSRPLPPKIASEYSVQQGIEIVEIVGGSPADRAGLKPEDLIVEIDGETVSDVGALQRLMVAERIGGRLEVTAIRGDRSLSFDLFPAELQD